MIDAVKDEFREIAEHVDGYEFGEADEIIDLGDDHERQGPSEGEEWVSEHSGILVTPDVPFDSATVRVSPYTDADKLYVLDDESGDVLLERECPDPGVWARLDHEFEAGEAVRVVVDSGGDSFDRGRRDADLPISGDMATISHGVYDGEGERSDTYRYAFSRFHAGGDRESDVLDLGSADESQKRMQHTSGVLFTPDETVEGLSAHVDSETFGVSRGLIKRHTPASEGSGEVLEEVRIRGRWVHFETALEAGEEYEILADKRGQRFDRGYRSVDAPVAYDEGQIGGGVYGSDGANTVGRAYVFDRLVLEEDRTPANTYGTDHAEVPDDLETEIGEREASTTIDVTDHDSIDHDGDLAAEVLSYLEDQSTVDHEIEIPGGRYAWDTELRLSEVEFLRITGEPDTEFVVHEQIDTTIEIGNRSGDARHVELEDLSFSIDGDGPDGHPLDSGLCRILARDKLFIDSIEILGARHYGLPEADGSVPDSIRGDKFTVFVGLVDSGGVGVVENLSVPHGSVEYTDSQFDHSICVSTDPPHEGRIRWSNCWVEDTPDNGFYLSNSPGENYLTDSFARNNGGTNIRPGTGDMAIACSVEMTNGSAQNSTGTGVWLQGEGALARAISIDAPDGQNDMIRANSSTISARFEDIEGYLGEDCHCRVMSLTQGDTDPSEFEGVVIDGFEITDESGTDSHHAIHCTRPDVELRNGTIDSPNRGTFNDRSALEESNVSAS
ncbi:hypothetical protein [Natronococcus roseus]|uniref:hypothetical protein n=1 Tax=Natronococcus roseus TaxID=1052014 RepID=UPI00374CC50F